MGLVDDQDRAGATSDLAQRVVITGLGKDDSDIRQGRFDEDRGDLLIGQGPLQGADVVERNDTAGEGGIDRLADVAVTRNDAPVRVEFTD